MNPFTTAQASAPRPATRSRCITAASPPTARKSDSSYKRGEPAEFPVNRVIPCWREGLQLMKEGGKAKLSCPPATTYGMRGSSALIPSNTTMQFEIELLSVR